MLLVQPMFAMKIPRALMTGMISLAASLLLVLSAKISIPFTPVPFTLQTGVVIFLGMALGWRLGGLAVATYLFEGAIGLPVFQSGGGLAYMMGPTGGFLMGFLFAAMFSGYCMEKGWGKTLSSQIVVGAAALLLLFTCGVLHLAAHIGLMSAVKLGALPFIGADLLKAITAAGLVRYLQTKQISKRRV